MAVTIHTVVPGSPAAKAGLCSGMRLAEIDGNPIHDGLDYRFYASAKNPVLLVQHGEEFRTLQVEKQEYEELGCDFESYLIDSQHPCRNRCTFCFIDQLPHGMRPSLYFKDDDERLGFLFGNYITLTNLSRREVDRIIAMRFSPVNISVHTANPVLRCQIMGNRHAGKALDIIPELAAAGIMMNFQLVLCPGVNDGEELEYSLGWLAGLGPVVNSIAAVPVGLTAHRQGLPHIQPYTAQTAAAQLDIMLAAGQRCLEEQGRRLIYPSDEWFLLAGRPLPEEDFYDGYPQLENGVGMWRLLHDEFLAELESLPPKQADTTADLITGELDAELIQLLADAVMKKYPGIKLRVHTVKNHFFGPGITVTGLLTGGDIATQLKGRLLGNRLLLPANCLRAEGDMMLDDMTPETLGNLLGTRVQVAPQDGAGLLHAILQDE